MDHHFTLFNEYILACTVLAVSGKSFILTEQLKECLNNKIDGLGAPTVLESLFNNVVLSKSHAGQEIHPSESNSVIVFCILLKLDLGHFLPIFTGHGISDSSLPLQITDLQSLSAVLEDNSTKLTADFFETQWQFSPATFELDGRYDWPPQMIIPICYRNLIARGRTATVYEVAIPEDFVGTRLRCAFKSSRYKRTEAFTGWCYRFALKVFDQLHKNLGQRETAIFQILKSHEGFVRPLAAFTTGEGQAPTIIQASTSTQEAYSILFECGDLDLSNYFASVPPPVTSREIEAFWGDLYKIVDSVRQLHEVSSDSSSQSEVATEIVGYHHDIKPSNILLSEGQFKLSDFGFGSFVDKEDDSISSSAAFGTISYGPPEPNLYTVNPTPDSLQKFDLWSLGCVLSEASTWVVLGNDGIERFQRIRRRALDKLYVKDEKNRPQNTKQHSIRRGDYFHDGTNVLTVVSSWHNLLRITSRKSDIITSKVLDIVDRKLLVSIIDERMGAKEVAIELSQIIEDSRAQSDLLPPIDQDLVEALEEDENED